MTSNKIIFSYDQSATIEKLEINVKENQSNSNINYNSFFENFEMQ